MAASGDGAKPYEAWTTCERHAQPFEAVRALAPELRVPPSLWLALASIAAMGFVVGGLSASHLGRSTWAFACFCASIASYGFVATLDLKEHLRLEKFVTGRFVAWTVIPLGESALHVGIVGCLLLAVSITLSQPALGSSPLLLATLGFFGLGWLDELLYHRRRALHREDILHTVSHLTGGAVFATLYLSDAITH
ncbi:hypothetical protein MK489_24995 [Myxococcota bacterium]|nr:hypothetical protein [Myxococcota bacterium]